jgi:hypothetical protein
VLFVSPPTKNLLAYIQLILKTAADLQVAVYQQSYIDRLQSPARSANPRDTTK